MKVQSIECKGKDCVITYGERRSWFSLCIGELMREANLKGRRPEEIRHVFKTTAMKCRTAPNLREEFKKKAKEGRISGKKVLEELNIYGTMRCKIENDIMECDTITK